MNTALFRCKYDGKLLRREDALKRKHLGHSLEPATNGTVFEWLKVKYWTLTGKI